MAEQKFHINTNGDVKECKATVRVCRFGGDVDHFTDHGEAIKAAEQRSKEKAGSDFGTVSKKTSKNEAISQPVVDGYFVKTIHNLSTRNGMTPEQFQEIGKVFEKEFEKRLSFNPWDHELSREELQEIQSVNREIFSSLVINGGDMPEKATGPMGEELNEAVRILPDVVKKITVKNSWCGRLDTNYLPVGYTKGRYVSSGKTTKELGPTYKLFGKKFAADSPVGSVVPKKSLSLEDVQNPNLGHAMAINDGSGFRSKSVWLGEKKPRDGIFNKIADSADVFVEGKTVTVKKPLYEIQKEHELIVPQILKEPNMVGEESASVLLHEYCHALQYGVKSGSGAESQMWESVAGHEDYSIEYNMHYHTGLANTYMGHTSRTELLPVATEGFLTPTVNNNDFFYGKYRENNADKIRRWVIGFWIHNGQEE